MGVLAAEHGIGRPRLAHHHQCLAEQRATAAVEIDHQGADRGVSVNVHEPRRRVLRLLPDLGIGGAKGFLGIIRAGENKQVHRIVVEILTTQQQVPGHDTKGRGLYAKRHLQTLGRGGRVHAATDAGRGGTDQAGLAQVAL